MPAHTPSPAIWSGSPAPSAAYRAVWRLASLLGRWGRLQVEGQHLIPERGPVLLLANHDSHTDPLLVLAAAGLPRPVRALAKHSLWRVPGLAAVLDAMGQIPVVRGGGGGVALELAVQALREGEVVGLFPEGTLSEGRPLRARSGAGRLAVEVPEAVILGVAVTGAVGLRSWGRPTLRVQLFTPSGMEHLRSAGEAAAVSAEVMRQVRELAPFAPRSPWWPRRTSAASRRSAGA